MTSEAPARLRAAGLRVTAGRLAVLAVLEEHSGHLAVAAVTSLARARLPALSTQAVYDILAALSGARLARRIEPAYSPARFEARVGDNHHHLVCRECGDVVDVDCEVGRAPCLAPSGHRGFAVDEAEITLWGFCPSCRNED